MWIDLDIENSTMEKIKVLQKNKHLFDSGVVSFINKYDDDFILEHWGQTVLDNKENILSDIAKIDSILSDIVGGYYHFRYFKNDKLFFNYDYGHKDEKSISFNGIGYVSLNDFRIIKG